MGQNKNTSVGSIPGFFVPSFDSVQMKDRRDGGLTAPVSATRSPPTMLLYGTGGASWMKSQASITRSGTTLHNLVFGNEQHFWPDRQRPRRLWLAGPRGRPQPRGCAPTCYGGGEVTPATPEPDTPRARPPAERGSLRAVVDEEIWGESARTPPSAAASRPGGKKARRGGWRGGGPATARGLVFCLFAPLFQHPTMSLISQSLSVMPATIATAPGPAAGRSPAGRCKPAARRRSAASSSGW